VRGAAGLPVVTAGIVVAGWLAFWVILFARPKAVPAPDESPTAPQPAARARWSWLGIAAQGLGYAIVWSPPHWGFVRRAVQQDGHPWGPLSVFIILLISGLTVSGVLIVQAAVHTLGRQWSLEARVTAGHRLVTDGPYARVRHPIYTGMLAMLIATALALNGPWSLLIALACFAAGTAQRVRLEERLLQRTFGAAFTDYASRVPAVLPRLRRPDRAPSH
jgi:protein-S-isoprenylcysteine O-methyltransferase Ste14